MDYIRTMRKYIGHETLFTVGCGAIIENRQGQILLQRRKDRDAWGIPGGVMELGETFHETLIREVKEETNLMCRNIRLFGLYSGPTGYSEYPNGDKVYSIQIIFHVVEFTGELIREGSESSDHKFFGRHELPAALNPTQAPFIMDWAEGRHLREIIVR
jgi:ADP-ribose pyrophosphatase